MQLNAHSKMRAQRIPELVDVDLLGQMLVLFRDGKLHPSSVQRLQHTMLSQHSRHACQLEPGRQPQPLAVKGGDVFDTGGSWLLRDPGRAFRFHRLLNRLYDGLLHGSGLSRRRLRYHTRCDGTLTPRRRIGRKSQHPHQCHGKARKLIRCQMQIPTADQRYLVEELHVFARQKPGDFFEPGCLAGIAHRGIGNSVPQRDLMKNRCQVLQCGLKRKTAFGHLFSLLQQGFAIAVGNMIEQVEQILLVDDPKHR